MNVRFVEDGKFRHSANLPEAPQPGQFVQLHDRFFKVIAVTWNPTPPFPYQEAGLIVDVFEVVGSDRPLYAKG